MSYLELAKRRLEVRNGEQPPAAGGDDEAAKEVAESTVLSWASWLAEQDQSLPGPVTYVEAPLRTVTTQRASWYAGQYLRTINFARMNHQTGGWGDWTPQWWKEREQEALGALLALRAAFQELIGGREHD